MPSVKGKAFELPPEAIALLEQVRALEAQAEAARSTLAGELEAIRTEVPPGDDPAWPFMLSAGERRSFTANTIIRDPSWRKLDADIALRVSPGDAARIGVVNGGQARLTTKRASAIVAVAVDEAMAAGHLALPNGLGLDHLEGAARSHWRRAERVHGQRRSRPVGGHAVAQEHSGAP